MTSIEIINEVPLSMVEAREMLKELKGQEKELPVRLNKTMEYLAQYTKADMKKVNELKEKLNKLEIARLRERHIIKIIDIMPKELDGLRLIFSGENVTLKQEDLQKILDALHGK
ncbi:MAG TPA: hypothetical protein VJH95_01370 [Candidatus Nanoarchaeia archaeon]|nr:hypothetical protein [Candidatus Nanoarchaeia archaeon]